MTINIDKKYSNLFLVNESNKIIKAKNHTHYLNLSKGMFNRKLLLHTNTIKNKNFWKKTKTLDTMQKRNMLTVIDISKNIEEFNKSKILNEDDYHYYTGNQINDMIYLKVNQDSQTFSSFSVITNDNLTVNDMGKSKKKIIPMCFNLHNSYTLPKLELTDVLFGAGFELFGNYNKTDIDPKKSKLPNLFLNPVGNAILDEVWDTKEKAYRWGWYTNGDTKTEWGNTDYLNISGIGLTKTKTWSLIMDIKFDGPLNDILFLFRSIDETSTIALQQAIDSNTVGQLYNGIDQGIAIINGQISFAGITYTKVFGADKWYTLAFSLSYEEGVSGADPNVNIFVRDENTAKGVFTKLTTTNTFSDGTLKSAPHNFASSVTTSPSDDIGSTPQTDISPASTSGDGEGAIFTFTGATAPTDELAGISDIKATSGGKNYKVGDTLTFAAADIDGTDTDVVITLTAEDIINQKTQAERIIWIGDQINLFRETHSNFTPTPNINTTTNGWVKNVYFTKHEINETKINRFKRNECNPID